MKSELLRLAWPGIVPLVSFGIRSEVQADTAEKPRMGYIAEIPKETAEERAVRHRKVAERHKGPAIIVHRGMSAAAPENTLEAYAAAMDFGADGCEMDLRRTADGVIVLFHDDMLDRLTNGFGEVHDLTYYELLSLTPQLKYGRATSDTRAPTFAAVLALARQSAMLLVLDVKEYGLEPQIAQMLTEADAWDHVVGVNAETAPALLHDPRFRPFHFKGPGLFEDRGDMNPGAVREQLAKPGDASMVDDPRVAAQILNRSRYNPTRIPNGIRKEWTPLHLPDNLNESYRLVPMRYLREPRPADSPGRICDLPLGLDSILAPEGPTSYTRRRTERILAVAWVAQQLGESGTHDRAMIHALEQLVRERPLHHDWMYHGLYSAIAARALGRLHAIASVSVLIEAFRRVDPNLELVTDPHYTSPVAWMDFRTKMTILPALGELRCSASKAFLLEYLAEPPEKVREMGPPLYDEAARAAMKQDLKQGEIEMLLRSTNTPVRGTAIQECLDHPTTVRTSALRTVAPWAKTLPRAR